ncbi:hypothetical protein HUA75_03010 [Myxococcus sp. CA040A]|uniref:Uncharacterized protein n=2 Tax=Myxococcaceae TaxID=31 RepID=A0A540WKS1_9BACT|nr:MULTISPECIES: hypothetical protein [unclassified Myxococcus]NTX00723.1 hypothetical protein [Myxococcus sp. CA040A]NTX12572.1 hypothetical protein [Myxococcus sp. CA056]NTX55916.1 hypothetical protein [Myxococcus sp. CA039A]TQF09615.1 hypothetical protein FJV41_43725 [Myxococcus llanfairpwllgwyngyllgogerychwyrndrobwllllantysiliogogogochensis]
MDATRVGRASRPARKGVPVPTQEPMPAPVPNPLAEQATTIRRQPPALPLERYALVAWVLGRERAGELLEGLGTEALKRAKAHLRRIAALPSAQRQAKVAKEFGERSDAAARLKALMDEVPELLRKEVFRRLPAYHRTLFPGRKVEPVDPLAPPLLSALAERLIREATR